MDSNGTRTHTNGTTSSALVFFPLAAVARRLQVDGVAVNPLDLVAWLATEFACRFDGAEPTPVEMAREYREALESADVWCP